MAEFSEPNQVENVTSEQQGRDHRSQPPLTVWLYSGSISDFGTCNYSTYSNMDDIAPEYDVVVLGTGKLYTCSKLYPAKRGNTAILVVSTIVTQWKC